MADVYKWDIDISGRLQGWTETYAVAQDGTTPNAIQTRLQTAVLLRQRLLGAQYQIDASRVQMYRFSNGIRVVHKGSLLEYPAPLTGLAGPANSGDSFRLSVKVNRFLADGSSAGRIYLGGFPDAICVDGGVLNTAAGGWQNSFNSYANELIAQGVGYLQHEQNETGLVTNYAVVQATGEVTITVTGGIFAVGDIGQKIPVTITGVNGGKARINGPQIVIPTEVDTCVLKKATWLEPFANQGFMTTYTYPFAQVATWQAAGVAGRKRGKSPLASRGRRGVLSRG